MSWKAQRTQPVASFNFLNGGESPQHNAFEHPLYKQKQSGRVLVASMECGARDPSKFHYVYHLFRDMPHFVRHVLEREPKRRSFYAVTEPHGPVMLFCDQELERDRHTLGKTDASKLKRHQYRESLCQLCGVPVDSNDAVLDAAYAQYKFDAHSALLCWTIRLCLELLYCRCLQTHWYVLCADRPGKKYSRHVHAPELWFPSGIHQLYRTMKCLAPMQAALIQCDPVMLGQDPAVFTMNRLMRMWGQRKEPTLASPPLVAHARESTDLDLEQGLYISMTTAPRTERLAPFCDLQELAALERSLDEQVWQPIAAGEPLDARHALYTAMQLAKCRPHWLNDDRFAPVTAAFDQPQLFAWPVLRQRALNLCFLVLRYYATGPEPPAIYQRMVNMHKLCLPLDITDELPSHISVWRELAMLSKCLFQLQFTSMPALPQQDRRWARLGYTTRQVFALVMGPVRYALYGDRVYRSYQELDRCEFTDSSMGPEQDRARLVAVAEQLTDTGESQFLSLYNAVFAAPTDFSAQSICDLLR